jgi:ribonuclease Z
MDSKVLTDTPVVGTPSTAYDEIYVAGTEPLLDGEIRVTVIGSGDPWPRKSQASGSLVIEVGNPQKDFFFFDLGSGALMNFTGLHLP